MPTGEVIAEAPKGLGMGEHGQQMLKVDQAAVSANGLRTSGLREQGSRGGEDSGKAVGARLLRSRPLA